MRTMDSFAHASIIARARQSQVVSLRSMLYIITRALVVRGVDMSLLQWMRAFRQGRRVIERLSKDNRQMSGSRTVQHRKFRNHSTRLG